MHHRGMFCSVRYLPELSLAVLLQCCDTGGMAQKLNEEAKATLRDAGVSQAAWIRANFPADGHWYGDACGCIDDRCIGHHHDEAESCGCLPSLLADYRSGEGMFADVSR